MKSLALVTVLTLVASEARAEEPRKDVPTLPAHVIKAPAVPSDFLVDNHGWLRIVHHPSTFEEARTVSSGADAHRASLAAMLGQSVLENVELRIARTPEELAALSPAEARPEANVDAVSYPPLSLMILVAHRGEANAIRDESFRHQLAHLALFDATAGRALPRWLGEGFALHASGDERFERARTLFGAHARRALLPFGTLESFPADPRVARAQSADFVRFLAEDGPRFASAIASTRAGESFAAALGKAYGRDVRALEQSWRDDVGTRNVTWPLIGVATGGWGLALAALVRRRRRRAAEPEIVPAPRFLEADRGLGHVSYIVSSKGVPKVEHDGKHHTLH